MREERKGIPNQAVIMAHVAGYLDGYDGKGVDPEAIAAFGEEHKGAYVQALALGLQHAREQGRPLGGKEYLKSQDED
jgi:hypothetical protein